MLVAALALLTVPQGKVEPDVVYRKVGDVELKMDIYRPAESAAPTPAVIVIHGGAWIEGKRQDMAGFGTELAKRGVFATTVQYRLATPDDKAPKRNYWPAMIDDVQSSVRYVRAHAKEFNIDPKRVGAVGLSAGAQLAMLLGTTDTRDTKTDFYPKESSRVSAVVEFAGPTNMEQDIPEPLVFLYKAVMGDEKAKVAEQIRSMSPILFVDKKTAPMFILHGTADTTVPVIHGRNMDEALKAKGIPHEAVFVEGAGHGLEKPEAVAALFRSLDWLRDQLKK
ncbi:alpha/beta hydrolase [bacterium]|nr:MAG: alpha/beta hydrolase [bacterium]